MRRLVGVITGATLLAWLAGCAHVVVDSDGTRHVTGFVVMTLPPVLPEVGADAIRMRSIGLTVISGHAAASQVAAGYSETTIVVMRNDALINRTALQGALDHQRQEE